MQFSVYVRACVVIQAGFLSLLSPLPSRAVLPFDCITCSAPVWLSLVGWWSFLASSEDQSDFLAPTFPHTHPRPSAIV